jgi:hypothetical protein
MKGTSILKSRPAIEPNMLRFVLQPIAVLIVELEVSSPIVPGQPLVFSWKASTIALRPLNLGQVTFALFLVDEFGNTDPNGQLYSKTLPASEVITPNDYQSLQYSTQLVGDLANRVYKTGQHPLRLVLTGTGPDGPFESSDVPLVVQRESINFMWWAWTVPAVRNAAWKNDNPPVHGTVINKSKYTSLVFKATLFEDNLTDGDGVPKEIGSDQPGEGPVPSGQSAPITFGAIDFSKSWSWFIKGIWVPNGTTIDRQYAYIIRLDVADSFQNGYDPVWTDSITIEYRVSDLKISTLAIATGLMAGALICFVTGAATICFGGATLIAIGGGMVTAAGISGAIASDPPTPDVRYRQRVKLAPLGIPRRAYQLRNFRPVAETLALTYTALSIVEAQSTVAGRILGARIAGDRTAEKKQTNHARSLRVHLKETCARVRVASRAAGDILARHSTATPEAVLEAFSSWRNDAKFRSVVRKAFLGAGRTSSEWLSMERLLEVPSVQSQIADMSAVICSIGYWAERLGRLDPSDAANGARMRAKSTARRRRR